MSEKFVLNCFNRRTHIIKLFLVKCNACVTVCRNLYHEQASTSVALKSPCCPTYVQGKKTTSSGLGRLKCLIFARLYSHVDTIKLICQEIYKRIHDFKWKSCPTTIFVVRGTQTGKKSLTQSVSTLKDERVNIEVFCVSLFLSLSLLISTFSVLENTTIYHILI